MVEGVDAESSAPSTIVRASAKSIMPNQSRFSLTDSIAASKNYLILVVSLIGLIGLLVGIAATSSKLETIQRWILIVFVIVFAILGLSVSVWLILRQARFAAVGASNRGFGWKTSPTDVQRRNLDGKLSEISRQLGNSEMSSGDSLSTYIVAEDLALRQIETESKDLLLRHQMIGAADFDAILFKQDAVVCVEIFFLVQPDIAQSKINAILKKIEAARKTFERTGKDSTFRLLLVLITRLDREGEARLRSTLVEKFSETTIEVEVRLFDFADLQKIYTIS